MASSNEQDNNGNSNGNGIKWSEYGRMVLNELERFQDALDKIVLRIQLIKERDLPDLEKRLIERDTDIDKKVLALQIKSLVYGGLAGSILGTIFSAIMFAVASHFIK